MFDSNRTGIVLRNFHHRETGAYMHRQLKEVRVNVRLLRSIITMFAFCLLPICISVFVILHYSIAKWFTFDKNNISLTGISLTTSSVAFKDLVEIQPS